MTHLLPADTRMDGGKKGGDGQSRGGKNDGEGERGEGRASVTKRGEKGRQENVGEKEGGGREEGV